MGLQRTVESLELFITLQEAKDHLRVNVEDDDAKIEDLIEVVQDDIETYINRSLMSQTWEYTLNKFPNGNILLPKSPIQSVKGATGNIKYIDADGVEITWAETEYDVFTNKMPGYVRLAFDKTYPSIRNTQDAIKITYLAGYARRELIPRAIVHAGFLILGHYYERREDTQSGGSIMEIPQGSKTLLRPHIMYTP